MIPTRDVASAVLVSLRGVWPATGDGSPPPPTAGVALAAWMSWEGGPGAGPAFGGGEPLARVRIRVSCSADAGDHARRDHARLQAQGLADDLRAVMLTDPLWSGEGWRVVGRWHESTATVPEPGALTVHQDFVLTVAESTASPEGGS